MNSIQPTPWYRQFWPWFIIALPFTAVVASFATLIIATQNPDGLVADNYYKEGLGINQALARDQQAAALGLSGLVRLDNNTQKLILTLTATGPVTQYTDLQLRMVHPTRQHLDRTLSLTHEGDDRWSTPLVPLSSGHWHLQLESAQGDWRMTGRLLQPEQQQAVLQPQAG
ncbi:MAG: FixH family protein [Gammaproteobacteria bacterium]|nr:FixH family protein [Gammaproteobacteria bacterium]